MARAQDQKRWRDNSGKKRVEVYLPEDTAAILDRLVSERGQSRAAIIAALIDAQPEDGSLPPGLAETACVPAPQTDGEASENHGTSPSKSRCNRSLGDERSTTSTSSGHRFRRPQTAAEKRYEWILIHDGEPLAGLKRRELGGWQGSYLKPSMLSRPCQRQTRAAVAKGLIEMPEIYR